MAQWKTNDSLHPALQLVYQTPSAERPQGDILAWEQGPSAPAQVSTGGGHPRMEWPVDLLPESNPKARGCQGDGR